MTSMTEHQIDVQVRSQFEADQSDPAENRYIFSYHIRIENHGSQGAQLLGRHWIILDGNGDKLEVEGEGVVGEQPNLAPGESFEYSSGTILATPIGSMYGTYQMISDSGQPFLATIPAFRLAVPKFLH